MSEFNLKNRLDKIVTDGVVESLTKLRKYGNKLSPNFQDALTLEIRRLSEEVSHIEIKTDFNNVLKS